MLLKSEKVQIIEPELISVSPLLPPAPYSPLPLPINIGIIDIFKNNGFSGLLIILGAFFLRFLQIINDNIIQKYF
jgi:hypothetical protein